jgi:hypothetical protein
MKVKNCNTGSAVGAPLKGDTMAKGGCVFRGLPVPVPQEFMTDFVEPCAKRSKNYKQSNLESKRTQGIRAVRTEMGIRA